MTEYGPATRRMLPIEIRPGVTVWIYGLPLDLTLAEATKMANIVMAYGNADVTESAKP